MTDISGKRITVLLIEDNKINQFLGKKIIERAGAEVTLASSAEEALELLNTHTFHLIFTDIQMPGMSGLEFTRKLRSIKSKSVSETPVITISGYADENDKEAALKAGVTDMLSKPFTEDEILKVLTLFSSQ